MGDSRTSPPPRPRSTERNLFLVALLHRLSVLLLLLLSSLFLVPFDTSSSLQRLGRPSSLVSHLTTSPVRWDSLHFLGLASPSALPPGGTTTSAATGGYKFESSTAFQPGIVWLLRITGMLGAGSDAEQWDLDVAVAVTSGLSVLAGALSVPLLYRLLLRHTNSHQLSSLAAHLSILSPSPSTLVTPTPEPFYSLPVLIGLLALAPSQNAARPGAMGLMGASLALGLATAFRANGILNVGFVWWELFWAGAARIKSSPTRILFSLLLAVPCTLAITGPFLLQQLWTWNRFCSAPFDADKAFQPRPWCGNGSWRDLSPWLGAYAHVQREYWGVGLFSYWTPAQLPNFLLAAPVLYLLIRRLSTYFLSSWGFLLGRILAPWRGDGFATPVEDGKVEGQAPAASRLLSASHHPNLIPLFLHTAIQAALLLFHSHVQIALRFASPGGMPLFWALFAHDVLLVRGQRDGMGKKGEAKALLWWLVLWNVSSTILYGAFYPPA